MDMSLLNTSTTSSMQDVCLAHACGVHDCPLTEVCVALHLPQTASLHVCAAHMKGSEPEWSNPQMLS